MKISVAQYAISLYEATDNKSEAEIKLVVKKLAELLIQNRDINKANEIVEYFSRLWDKERGELQVDLMSARTLDDKIKAEIETYLKDKTNAKTVNFSEQIDTKILGGFVARYENKIVDGSIKNNLNNLKNKISN